MEQPPPEVLALIVADHVYRDDVSGKYFILGTRHWLAATDFPYTHPRLAAYVVLVGGRGETALEVRLVDVDEVREPVFADERSVTFPDPLAIREGVFSLEELVFPEPGEYRFQLYANGQFLRERRVFVFQVGGPN
jgi:hypothetical protein